MVLLHCRECGAEIKSDTRQTKCPQCGALFPFACAVCGKLLKPPIPDFPVERYFTAEHKPLCEDHYQRQCPECQEWFQASDNPGYFLCPKCAAKRSHIVAGGQGAGDAGSTATADASDEGYVLSRSGDDDDDDLVSRSRAAARSRAVRRDESGAESRRGAGAASRKGCGLGLLLVAVLTALAVCGGKAIALAALLPRP